LLFATQYPVHEMMTILSGSVTLTSTDDGTSETFTAGDTFLLPKVRVASGRSQRPCVSIILLRPEAKHDSSLTL